MNRKGVVREADQKAAMSSWIRGVVLNDLSCHEHNLDLARCDHPLGMGHLANCMRKKENPTASYFPHSGQDFRVLHGEYSTRVPGERC